MHIAQIFDGYVPPSGYGGIERVVYWLSLELEGQGHEITIVAKRPPSFREFGKNIRFVDFELAMKGEMQWAKRIDIAHYHNDYYPNLHGTKPFLVTEHGNNKRKTAYSRNTVFLSRSHAANHNAEYYIPNGIPLIDYPFREHKINELAFMARLNWRAKNARTAINLSFDTDTPIHLSGGCIKKSRKIWGRWLLKYLFKKRLLIEHGDVDGEEKLRILSHSMALFYLVNWHEPFALAPHEALACGTPILATPNGALAEYIEHGINGFIVHNYQEAVSVVNILKHMSDSDRSRMAKACRRSAYSITDSVSKYLGIYEQIIDTGFLYTELQARGIRFKNPPALILKK